MTIDLAKKFVECGFVVFPLYGRKRLKPYGWARNEVQPDKVDLAIPATDDPREVALWPEQVKAKYNSVVSGFGVLGVNCVIVDLDIKDGRDGVTPFMALVRSGKIPKPTMVTVTKSGGLHCFYKRPADYVNRYVKTVANAAIDGEKQIGLDVRGDGGFVVGPDDLVDRFDGKPLGVYWCRGLKKVKELSEFPGKILSGWCRVTGSGDLDAITSLHVPNDFMSMIRRGEIPSLVPKGSRNEAFFVFANVLKSKGVPVAAARHMMTIMAEKVEEPETFTQSVDIDDMLSRVYVVRQTNPYDVAVDLIDRGLIQLTGHKNKLNYILLENNPYFSSKSPHDEASMKTLLKKYQATIETKAGTGKSVNPMDVVTKIIGDESRADYIGFKPNAGAIFSVHDDPGSRRFLNTYRPVIVSEEAKAGHTWAQFLNLVERLFGERGSKEYQLGIDFMAWLIQKPQIKPSIAPFLLSFNRGVGKSLLFNVLTQILGTSKIGDRQARIVKLDEITGRFFDPTGCVINLIDEVQFPVHRDMRKESVTFWRHLKNLITAETVSVEIKGGATYQVPNSAAIMMAGNMGNSFPIEEFDRRLWVIDANASPLEKGMMDDLFDLVRGTKFGPDERQSKIFELRRGLCDHEIVTDLSSIRAPMTEAKRDLFLGSLTHTEEWFVRYFETPENMFALEPVITKSAFLYVVNAMDPMKMFRFRDDPDVMWRDMKRRGYLRSIKVPGHSKLSRQAVVPVIGMDGVPMSGDKKEVLYTTRDHGSMDEMATKDIVQAYTRNVNTIREFKTGVRKSMTAAMALEVS